jgi:type VI secretion system protein VasJ
MTREVEPLSVVPYRLARVIKWDHLSELPPADSAGTTQIPGPREEHFSSLRSLRKAGNWKDLAEESEVLFLSGTGTYFLDLQRYIHKALKRLGANDAAEAVFSETGRFLVRLPGVERLKFASGRSFAQGSTNGWLKEAVDNVSGPPQTGICDQDDTWAKDATDLAEKDNIPGAMKVIQKALLQAEGQKSLMMRKLQSARLCLNFGHPEWAAPVLDELSEKIDETRLKNWDPGYCSDVWELLIQAYQQLGSNGQLGESQNAAIAKARANLFHTDLLRASSLPGG